MVKFSSATFRWWDETTARRRHHAGRRHGQRSASGPRGRACANQRWSFRDLGEIVNENSRLCLDIPNGSSADGALLQQFHCHGGPNQLWRLGDKGEIVNENSGKCLDIPSGATADQVVVQQFTCNGGTNQSWATK
jgi:Ricin-type beta-trefoil lectin domain